MTQYLNKTSCLKELVEAMDFILVTAQTKYDPITQTYFRLTINPARQLLMSSVNNNSAGLYG
jgi:phage anti-repressor protein